MLMGGDVLFARSGATVGKTFRYDQTWGRAAHAGYLIRARLNERVLRSCYLVHFTQSGVYWNWLSGNFIQATIQNVSAERYANLAIPVPPTKEQDALLDRLDDRLGQLGHLVAKVNDAITHLKELRTALISAAVTGQIDVREG